VSDRPYVYDVDVGIEIDKANWYLAMPAVLEVWGGHEELTQSHLLALKASKEFLDFCQKHGATNPVGIHVFTQHK